MEISFKWPSFYFCLLCFQLCNGKSIASNDKEIDFHSELLTGLISLLLTVCCLVFLAVCLCCKQRKSFQKFRNSPVIASSLSDIDHGHVNPIANGEFTIFSPLSPSHFNNNVFHPNFETKTRTVEDSVENSYDIKSWFGTTDKDFPRNKLKYIRELGTGWFGKVVQGAAQDSNDTGQSWTPVVVRILEATSSHKEKVLFLQDAAIYRSSSHINILSLIGRSLETVPFLLLQEYCPQGDLKGYLQSNKADAEKLLSTEYPLIWCCQLTSAVKHIHQNNIAHLDLASRNCQLTSNLTLKLGDYGLGPFKYPADYYQGLPTVPVRWCAPESLICTQTTIQPKKITPEANVWSLGVTMWEICECGEQPYKALSDDEVISQVLGLSNVRLWRPAYSALYTDYIFRLMQSCWTSVESRPTVSQIDTMLTDLLQVHRNTTYNTLDIVEFDRRWESSKPNIMIKTNHISEVLLTPELNMKKSLSPSLNNLHGSLDNLADESKISIENETKNDSLTSHRTSVSDTEFKFNSNLLYQRTTSSGSETEDENWRNKVERGAYTEKVRQKSKSVTDLMILTHVDYSESESETPLPSLDYRVNYKNVRLAGLEGSSNLENANITFGSEGNLLSVQDTFQEELRKLQEERRDSLPFVPDTVSQNSFSNTELSSSSSKLMQELNSPAEIKPANQVFNVYNVTIENFSPVKVHNKMEEIIDFNQKMREVDCKKLLNVTKGSESCDKLNESKDECEAVNLNVKFGSDNDTQLQDINSQHLEYKCNENGTEISINLEIKELIIEELNKIINNLPEDNNKLDIEKIQTKEIKIFNHVPKLSDIIILNSSLTNVIDKKINKNKVNFDLSLDQEEAKPNSLTHFTLFSSTPLRKRDISLPSEDTFSSLNLFSTENDEIEEDQIPLNYSLETWDNFLGTTLDSQNEHPENMFDSFSSEPQSLLFIESEIHNKNQDLNKENIVPSEVNAMHSSNKIINATFNINDKTINRTYEVDKDNSQDKSSNSETGSNSTFSKKQFDDLQHNPADKNEGFDNEGGWFLHPQPTTELCGDIQIQSPNTDSYIGFGIDDEIMSAIRNELLSKLPHAQGANADRVKEEEEEDWDTCERNEVFLRYNVYNTPLSPIPEESYIEDGDYGSHTSSPKPEQEYEDIDWSGRTDTDTTLAHEIDSNSAHTLESPIRGQFNRHTPSQDSCCSNDTLFNLEELICVTTDLDKDTELALNLVMDIDQIDFEKDTNLVSNQTMEQIKVSCELDNFNKTFIDEFLLNERNHSAYLNKLHVNFQSDKQIVPLPSPEDNPWKQLPASLLTFKNVTSMTHLSLEKQSTHTDENVVNENMKSEEECESNKSEEQNLTFTKDSLDILRISPSEKMLYLTDESEVAPIEQDNSDKQSTHTDENVVNENMKSEEESDKSEEQNLTYTKNGPDIMRISPSEKMLSLTSESEVAPIEQENSCKQLPASLLTFENITLVTHLSPEKQSTHTDESVLNENMKSEEECESDKSEEQNLTFTKDGLDILRISPSEKMLSLTNESEVAPIEQGNSCKQLPASLLTFENITSVTNLSLEKQSTHTDKNSTVNENLKSEEKCESDKSEEQHLTYTKDGPDMLRISPSEKMLSLSSESEVAPIEQDISDKENIEPVYENTEVKEHIYENEERTLKNVENNADQSHLYENTDVKNTNSEIDSYEDYINIVNMENDRNRLECDVDNNTYIDIYGHDEDVQSEDDNIYGILTDIRFTGPTDSQMMSTSFSEHNDEQGWESGSDSRSSSSGEFIWKEGEHEESLKTLRAAPQDALENIKPMEGIVEDAYEESDVSSSFTDDEETPEFVPSAWDKFALPSKSALRTLEKPVNKTEEGKPKGVWFKKQKYHCIYEYPKEPESPVLQSQDLWKPQTDLKAFSDWEFDGELYVPSQASEETNYSNTPSSILSNQNLYHLTSITDFVPENPNSTNADEEFFISSSTQPFHAHSLSSQFFPGSRNFNFDNVTPDSGVEDITPISITDSNEFSSTNPIKQCTISEAVAKNKLLNSRNSEVMGGLRHTRNKLKLDLPPSPSAFTSDKPFTIEPIVEHVIREKPAFTTFGKSRFMVQHVDTPPDETNAKNVSFEALPYQPFNPIIENHSDLATDFDVERSLIKNEDDTSKLKVEVVRGEASLLDSGDEDSGIESASTLERKITNSQL